MRTTAPRRVRLFVAAPLATGAEVALTPAQAHYLGHVLRLAAGAAVFAFNGRDGEWRAVLAAASRGGARLVCAERTRAHTATVGPWLAFAPLKKDSQDFVVIKATELGAARLLPVFTRYTATTRINGERVRANAIEAAEQCGRLDLPVIDAPVSLDDLLAAWPADRALLAADPGPGATPIAAALAVGAASPPPAFLIGPEGGLAAGELDALARLPFAARVHLGPRILRAETAAIACLAVWQALAGAGCAP